MTNAFPENREVIKKAKCSNCGGVRNCDIHGHRESHLTDGNYSSSTTWYLLECRGCETVFVQTVSSNSEDYGQYHEPDGSGDVITVPNETFRYWPALSTRANPEWMDGLAISGDDEGQLKAAMAEVYGALDADLQMLAGIGIRTTFDVASGLLGIDTNLPFAKKLAALVDTSRIGAVDKVRIEVLVDAGSASAHRGWCPSTADLTTMMDILEHFVFEAFVGPARKEKLNEDAAAVRNKVPQRGRLISKNVAQT